MFKIKSFQRRILTALMGIGLVPAVLLLLLGIVAFQWFIGSAGTAGPWTSLAASGQALLDAVAQAEITDSTVAAAAEAHREALSDGLRLSQLFEFIADRILTLVPLVGLILLLIIAGLSYLVGRQLSRGFSRPIHDLVGWTELIRHNEGLPPPGPAETRGVQEFTVLRRALRTMADDLEKGRLEAVQAAKLRSWTDMARRVAHELKNPLAPMRMAATHVARMEGAVAKQASEVLLEEIERLDELARTFSQFGRMPEGPPSEIDVEELLQVLLQQHDEVGPTLTCSFEADTPLIVGHYDALLRSFRNLLLNAIDAAGDDGTIQILGRSHGGHLQVEIRDSGPGIPPDHIEEIWDPDFTTKNQGTGLGLAMVRQTILAHQGLIEARNNPDGGAVFVVRLPI